MLAVATILAIYEGRPIFYVSERMRAPGEAFNLIKFRTMAQVDEDAGATGAHKAWRITRLGKFLRRTRIDELPQLFNILRGDMSFVGPRPPLREYVERFRPWWPALPPGVYYGNRSLTADALPRNGGMDSGAPMVDLGRAEFRSMV